MPAFRGALSSHSHRGQDDHPVMPIMMDESDRGVLTARGGRIGTACLHPKSERSSPICRIASSSFMSHVARRQRPGTVIEPVNCKARSTTWPPSVRTSAPAPLNHDPLDLIEADLLTPAITRAASYGSMHGSPWWLPFRACRCQLRGVFAGVRLGSPDGFWRRGAGGSSFARIPLKLRMCEDGGSDPARPSRAVARRESSWHAC
jgi:hypothetical protein